MLPPCYGIYWEGVEGSDCTSGKDGPCSVLNECLAKFATGTLSEYQNQLGGEATPEKLSEITSVSPEAILLAINFQKNTGLKPEVVKPPEESEPVAPPSNLEEPVTPEPPDDLEKAQPEPPDVVESVETVEGVEKAEIVETEPEDPKPKKKKERKKRKTKKKELVNPTVAEPVQSATGSVENQVQKKSVRNASALGAKVRRWDPIYNKTRWERERERSPLIAQLTPGMKLVRRWKGVETVTIVERGYYRYNEERYPTLYSVVVAITGTKPSPKQKRKDGTRLNGSRQMTSWSAVRFFKLRQLMEGITDK